MASLSFASLLCKKNCWTRSKISCVFLFMNIVLFVLIVLLFQICLNPFWYVKNLVYNQIFLLFFSFLFGLFPLSQKLTTFPRPSACWCYYPLYSLAFITTITQSFCSIERCKRRGKNVSDRQKRNFCCRSHTYTLPFLHIFQIILYWKVSFGCGFTCGNFF